MDLPPDFKELLEAFGRAAVEYVVLGGYAVAFHGRPRHTKDIDILLNGSTENLARAADALAAFGAPAKVADSLRTMSDDDIVWFGAPPLRVDFLRRADGIDAATVVERAVHATIDGISIRFISRDDLIANKRASGRPQDLEDARLLEAIAGG